MKYYRLISISFMIIFAVVGSIFLFAPDSPLTFFNSISRRNGMQEAPLQGGGFYLILASAYMYMVTVLSYFMYRRPLEKVFPLLLANAKFASSALSIALFLFHSRSLIYFANFAVDGLIGAIAVYFYLNIGKSDK
jgi:hypothetical protein